MPPIPHNREGRQAAGQGIAEDSLRVLLLLSHSRDAELTAGALTTAGFAVRPCNGFDDLTRVIVGEEAGLAILAEETLTPPALDTLERILIRQPPWSDLPLIILTGGGRASGAWEAILQESERLSNATFLERPLRIATLVRAVRVGLRSRCRQYEIRGYLHERERAAAERLALIEQQRTFLRDVLTSVTEGRLRLCDSPKDLPPHPGVCNAAFSLKRGMLRRLRRETVAASRMLRIPAERVDDLVTAVNEAAMNAVCHAGGGSARVYVDAARGILQVWIEDQGSGIDMARLPRATLERGYSSAGTLGHGFWLMLQTCDVIYLLTGPEGTTIVIEQGVTPPPPAWRLDRNL
jgi:anti-sigma regulatory factor (Ser/Thr protein kinase)